MHICGDSPAGSQERRCSPPHVEMHESRGFPLVFHPAQGGER